MYFFHSFLARVAHAAARVPNHRVAKPVSPFIQFLLPNKLNIFRRATNFHDNGVLRGGFGAVLESPGGGGSCRLWKMMVFLLPDN
jgi:hypothetical protein